MKIKMKADVKKSGLISLLSLVCLFVHELA